MTSTLKETTATRALAGYFGPAWPWYGVNLATVCGRHAGRVRQAWYAATRRAERTSYQTDAILQEVRRVRREVPGMGTHKLHNELRMFLTRHHIKLGRDRLHMRLKEHGMLAKKKASKVATTESNHPHYKYPNKVKNLKPARINKLWQGRLCGK